MAKYDTRVLKKGSFTVTISKEAKSDSAGDRLEAFLKILAGIMAGTHPDQGLPGAPGKPDQGLPPGVDNTLPEPPVAPVDPVYPDNSLPEAPPTAGHLPAWSGENAKAIVKAILGNCVDCPTATPHK